MSIEFLVKEMFMGDVKKKKFVRKALHSPLPQISWFILYCDESPSFFFYACFFNCLEVWKSLWFGTLCLLVFGSLHRSYGDNWYLSFISLSSNTFTSYCYFFLFSHLFFGGPSILYHVVVFIQTSFYNNWVIVIFTRIYFPSDFLIQ